MVGQRCAHTDITATLCACSSTYAAQNVEVLNALCGLLALSTMPVSALWTVGWLLLQVMHTPHALCSIVAAPQPQPAAGDVRGRTLSRELHDWELA